MLQKLNKREKGFTIIEVLIVLAIAALILLIVFLAVPALKRSAQNTTLKNDASSLAGGFSEYESNNGGVAPASITYTTPNVTIGGANSVQSTVKLNGSTSVDTTQTKPNAYASSTLYWKKGKDCSGTASPSAVAVYYYLESTNSATTTKPQCVDG